MTPPPEPARGTPAPAPRPAADGTYSSAWRNFTRVVLPPSFHSLMHLDMQGQDQFPAGGGMILAANHLSYMDVPALSMFVYSGGRYPVFLAKSSLFEVPVLGFLMRRLGQLPVYRGQVDAGLVLRDAERIGLEGACLMFYPESTVTRDPDQWPMVAKTGVARLALASGVPVVPVAHWGAQRVLPYGKFLPRILPRRTVQVLAGPPVDLSEFEGQPLSAQVLRAATDKIMAEVTALLGELRGEKPPTKAYHPAVARRKLRQDLRALQQAQTDEAQIDEAQPGSGPSQADEAQPGSGPSQAEEAQEAEAAPAAQETGQAGSA